MRNLVKAVKKVVVKEKVVKPEVTKPSTCSNCNDSGMTCIVCRVGIDAVDVV